MKRQIRTPYFEIGTKNYIYGDTVLEYALAADAAAEKYDIDVLFITPAVEIRRVVEQTKHLIVLAPIWTPSGRAGGWPTSCRKPSRPRGRRGWWSTTARSRCPCPRSRKPSSVPMSWICWCLPVPTPSREAKAVAQLHPDILNPEPSELIGGAGSGVSSMDFVRESIQAIKSIYPDILVEQAAGITNGQQVYDFIMAGSEAAGAASGIVNAKDPLAMIDEMIAATRRAADDLKNRR